jgi:hypothetical protein
MLDTRTKIDLINTDPNLAQSITFGPQPDDEFLGFRLGNDYRRYQEMRRDPHVRSTLQKRRQSILARRLLVKTESKKLRDRAAVETTEAILSQIPFESMCSSLLNTGQLIGFSVIRMDWVQRDSLILPKFQFVPQNRFSFAFHEPTNLNIPTATGQFLDPRTDIILVDGYELRLLTKASPYIGERCPKGRFIVYTFDSDNSPWGLGLGYSIFPWWTIKREATKNWLMHGDRTGSPPVVGTHPSEINPKIPEQAEILNRFEAFLQAVSPSNWARLPEGFAVNLVENDAVNMEMHDALIALSDAQISKVVLGEVPFSEKTTGSYAATVSQVEDREQTLIDADCNRLDEQLQECLWQPIAELNYPNALLPIVRRETVADQREQQQRSEEEQILLAIANRDNILMTQLSLIPTDEYIKETYGAQWSYRAPGSTAAEPQNAADFAESTELDDTYQAYREMVNMTASELEAWAETEAAQYASLDSSPIQRNLELLRTPKAQWSAKHIRWANRTISFISRMSGMPKGKPVSDKIPFSKRDISLRNWAYNCDKSKDYADDLADSERFRVGTRVTWNWGQGQGIGKISKIYTDHVKLQINGVMVTRNATEDNPAYLIEQENGAVLLKSRSELQRHEDYADPLDSGHNLLSDEEWDELSRIDEAVIDEALNQDFAESDDLEQMQAHIDAGSTELTNLAEQLDGGDISLRQFQQESAKVLRRAHVQNAVLGHGGRDKLNPADWLSVGRELKRQYYAGRDEVTGERFGLKWLTDAIQQGLFSLAQVKRSLTLYAKSAKLPYFKGKVFSQRLLGKTFAIRQLAEAEHCPECLDHAEQLPQPIQDIVLPTQRCRCGNNCKCSILALTLEEAIERGLRL